MTNVGEGSYLMQISKNVATYVVLLLALLAEDEGLHEALH